MRIFCGCTCSVRRDKPISDIIDSSEHEIFSCLDSLKLFQGYLEKKKFELRGEYPLTTYEYRQDHTVEEYVGRELKKYFETIVSVHSGKSPLEIAQEKGNQEVITSLERILGASEEVQPCPESDRRSSTSTAATGSTTALGTGRSVL